MGFILDNQLLLIFACFAAGLVGTIAIFRQPAGSRAWKIADLIWVFLGGVGALAAILAGAYKADSSQLDRQIDLAFVTTQAFDRDAARFRLRHCEGNVSVPERTLCDKVEFLQASTALNSDLPLFLSVAQATAPRGVFAAFRGIKDAERDDMMDRARTFRPAEFLAFVAQDDATEAAITALAAAPDTREIAAGFRIIAQTYEQLIDQIARLRAEWELLQSNARILVLQVLALCLVAFAAPFRLGKSAVELR